jgi:hypothetical protein
VDAPVIAEERRIAVEVRHLRAVGERHGIACARKERRAEERPEPRCKEHHLGGDEEHHAVTQAEPDDGRSVLALETFGDDVTPPADHRHKHAGEAQKKEPVSGQREHRRAVSARRAEHEARLIGTRMHPCDRADHHGRGGDRSDDRPRARIDEMILVLDLGSGHGSPSCR